LGPADTWNSHSSRISLISKRDIRFVFYILSVRQKSNKVHSYVGTLHEISSENSTVALENVTSYGTEGRRPEEEIPPNLDSIYEYIVFRGSDVKDLRIEEGPKEAKKPDPPKMPDDPAILGVSHIHS
jgi:protein LSM14